MKFEISRITIVSFHINITIRSQLLLFPLFADKLFALWICFLLIRFNPFSLIGLNKFLKVPARKAFEELYTSYRLNCLVYFIFYQSICIKNYAKQKCLINSSFIISLSLYHSLVNILIVVHYIIVLLNILII